jgi:hypothetical protein
MIILAKGDTYLEWRSLADTGLWDLRDRNILGGFVAIAKYIFSFKHEREDRYSHFHLCLFGLFLVRTKK